MHRQSPRDRLLLKVNTAIECANELQTSMHLCHRSVLAALKARIDDVLSNLNSSSDGKQPRNELF